MPSTTTLNLQSLITQEATTRGVPPAIALAVAQQESSFDPNARGAAGEIGMFQIMPATGAMLGYTADSLTDPSANAAAGISFLGQLFAKYGSWAAALSAYNSGSPSGSPDYASSVLSKAANFGLVPAAPALPGGIVDGSLTASDLIPSSISPSTVIVGGILAVGVVLWWMQD